MHFAGVVDDWALGTFAQRLWENNTAYPGFARLIDARSVSEWVVETKLVTAIAEDVRAARPRKIALIGTLPAAIAAFEAYAGCFDRGTARAFSELETAAVWLGVRLPEPWPPTT